MALIRVYDDAGNLIQTHEHKGRCQDVVSGDVSGATPAKQKAATR